MNVICPICKFENRPESAFCTKCGSKIPSEPVINNKEMTQTIRPDQFHEPHFKTIPAPDYAGLKTVIRFYDFIAWFAIIFAVVGAIFVLFSDPLNNISFAFIIMVAILVFGFFSFISMKAMSEGIKLFIDIESNTRKTAKYILQLVATQNRDRQ